MLISAALFLAFISFAANPTPAACRDDHNPITWVGTARRAKRPELDTER